MRSSYLNNLDYSDLIKSTLYFTKPKNIIEYGILDGYSLKVFSDYSVNNNCVVKAYDIFEEFNGNHANQKEMEQKFCGYQNVKVDYGNFFTGHINLKDNSIDLIHVDIANDGKILQFTLDYYMPKITRNGVILFEGGSIERDEVEWMDKYSKDKIDPVIQSNKQKFVIETFGKFPSLTIIKKV